MSQNSSLAAEERRRQLDYITSITKLYFLHSPTLFASSYIWSKDDRYYFIELRLDMAYVSSSGFIARIADPPYYLGTIVKTTYLYPELFMGTCPNDDLPTLACSYSGSPLSERVTQHMVCIGCGWEGETERRGWHTRSKALRKTQAEDLKRHRQLMESNPDFKPADLRDLLRSLGVPEEDLVLPEIERKIETRDDGRFVHQRDPYGGVKIEDRESGCTTYYDWHGLDE